MLFDIICHLSQKRSAFQQRTLYRITLDKRTQIWYNIYRVKEESLLRDSVRLLSEIADNDDDKSQPALSFKTR